MNHHDLGLSKRRRTVMVIVVMVMVVMVMVVMMIPMVMHRVMVVMHGVVVVVCYVMGNISSVSRMLGLMVL